ncbi:putative FAD monooxygenase [Aspergillus fischeri NRRL 181]|uniref:FAD binding domain protein n=1 Tax=Neosartorya fischeri (strain ATCC 1020 / DSM 3700 / CBS 544.65 / FGSC A1164 / JCM 1740 / NRRL 181 / WB 181) TaxID=331117 RepID=A1DD16_NEOFI|nr:FAD binding domain protein [Aspergillus fischeri NRRL 181]EAW19726.1 FAD binding domain protein [Aspergillus fischeri NRRL 181]
MPPHTTDLLIIGAGPAGLMAACWASHYNMSTRIIDQKSGRTTTGHADGIHSRTLEIFNSFGLVDPIIRQGVPDVEMCYWGPNKDTGKIERRKRLRSQSDSLSQYGQMLFNQGGIEQILLDYLSKTDRIAVEWNTRAETLTVSPGNSDGDDDFPVAVGVSKTTSQNDRTQQTETIHARYVIACDGAQSCTRTQLDVPMESHPEHSTWGVIDIVPITDFPDIRQSCAIQCPGHGSIMTAPRENRLVRFYIQVKGDEELEKMAQNRSEDTPRALIKAAERWISPYKLSYKHCDWWSIYPDQGQVRNSGTHLSQLAHKCRIFLAGDAAHTHSPKAGQGMNVSMQDTYNLVWKLGSVITGVADPIILDTYKSERRPVAEELMKMDSVLVHAYEQEAKDAEGVDQVRDEYSGFMAGVKITYAPNMLVASNEKSGDRALAKNIAVGMRLPSFPVVNQADGSTVPLLNVLPSNGCWRLIVFSGDLRRPSVCERLTSFAESFTLHSHLAHQHQTGNSRRRGPPLETLLVHASSRTSINLLDLPDLFHPFDDELGWDYWKTFADDDAYDPESGKAYAGYGIDRDLGCLVLCRPDQHVGWIGSLDEIAGLDNYFSEFSRQ